MSDLSFVLEGSGWQSSTFEPSNALPPCARNISAARSFISRMIPSASQTVTAAANSCTQE